MKKRKPRPTDPDLFLILQIIAHKTPKEIAENSIIGASTIRNWRKGLVKTPLHYTMQAALRACNYKWKIIKCK